MSLSRFHRLLSCVGLCMAASIPAHAQMRITEFMYQGATNQDAEFVEFTNVGNTPVDMTGYSYSDSGRTPGAVDLSGFGTVKAGESVILTGVSAADFRGYWDLCDAVKVIGGNTTQNLGRSDEINLYDAGSQLVDRLTYNDQASGGGPRTNGKSAWVNAAGLGNNLAADWTLSSVGDAEGSYTSSNNDVGSPGRSARATVPFVACHGDMRITEYLYKSEGGVGEFVEFTNVGNAAVDMTGWSYDSNLAVPGSVDLSMFGKVSAGESVILTETTPATFRSAWGLCDNVKVVGGSTRNLGRNDQINLWNAAGSLIDRLDYGDQTYPGSVRADGKSAWVNAAGLGANQALAWTLSSAGDTETSWLAVGNDVGSPGKSTRATVTFDPCAGVVDPNAPTITVDTAATSTFLDLSGVATASGVIDDPTDPAATDGIGFSFALPGGGDASTLAISASSSNAAVVDAAGLVLSGSGATRQLTIAPHGVGYATITVSAVAAGGHTGTFTLAYAASAAAALTDATRFHTGASDASATIAIDDDTMFVADDETNTLRLYDRNHSGLPLAGFDFSNRLSLPDAANPELDLEGSARIGNRLYWTGSYSNSKNFHVRPNRHRVFATDLSGAGAAAMLAYAGRYDWLLEDLVAWDAGNGHGLGANYLGFAAGSAEGIDSKTPAGFNIEGLSIAPDNQTAYFAFRAPQLPTNARHDALIVPVLDFDALVAGAAPDSLPQGSAHFGTPIFLDLGGRGIRSLDRNAAGQYLITAGPAGDATGVAPSDFRLYAWTGQPGDAPFDLGLDMTALDVNGGSFESIAEVPDLLGVGTSLQFLFDNGDSPWYGDGIAAKDLADGRLKKAASLRVGVDIVWPAASLAVAGGASQSAMANTAFAAPLTVQVEDAYGQPVAGVHVAFTAPATGASATLSATDAVTGSDGRASVSATANTQIGSYVVTAQVGGVAAQASFALSNVAAAPASVSAVAGTPQSSIVGQAFAAPLVVHVVDAYGNPVAGANVAFGAPAGGASANLQSSTVVTDGSGDAQVVATANAIAGSYTVEASVDGVATVASFALVNTIDPLDLIFRDGFDAASH